MADETLPPLPQGSIMDDLPPLPKGATMGESSVPKASPVTPSEKPKKPMLERVKDVAAETGVGTVGGYFAPELMQGAGMLAGVFPVTAPIAPFLLGAGTALKGQRAAQTGLGAISGFSSGVLGESADAMGASPSQVEAIRLGSSIVAPEFANLAGWAIKKGIQKVTGLGVSGALSAVAKDMGVDEAKLTPSQREYLLRQIEDVRGKSKSGVPQQEIFNSLDAEAQRILSKAKQESALAERAGTSESLKEKKRAAQLGDLSGETEQAGKTILQRAKDTVTSVGDVTKDLSDMGRSLRDKITERFSSQSLERSDAYKKQQAIRDAAVAEKESKGVFLESTPEYKELINKLKTKLLLGKEGRAQTTAPVTEKGVLNAYQSIYDAVTGRKVMTGVNEMGNPTYKTYPTSFQALDDVRRRLGDVAFGKEVEGYTAIGSNVAKDFYAELSELQSKFAGESQDVLQRNYELASRLLDKYKAKSGAKVAALDKFDPTKYKTDAKSLPGDFFNSQQSVQDLIELTGDRALVVKEAGDYLARQLQPLKDSSAVRSWLNSPKNSDWLKALPEVRQRAESYISNLQRAEGFVERTGKVSKNIGQRSKMAEAEAGEIIRVADKEAGKITKEAEAFANKLIGSKEAPMQIKNMILSGDRETWNAIAPVLKNTPNGRGLVADAVAQIMADRASTGVRSAGITFRDAVAPALRRTGLMGEKEVTQLQAQLDAIAQSAIGEEEKLSFSQRIVKDAIVGYVAPGVYRTGKSAYDILTGKGKPTSVQPRM